MVVVERRIDGFLNEILEAAVAYATAYSTPQRPPWGCRYSGLLVGDGLPVWAASFGWTTIKKEKVVTQKGEPTAPLSVLVMSVCFTS